MNNNQCVAFSDSVEEINAIREIILKKQFWELSQKYKDMLPEQIYARLVNADFYRRWMMGRWDKSNNVEYKGINIGRRDLFETINY